MYKLYINTTKKLINDDWNETYDIKKDIDQVFLFALRST